MENNYEREYFFFICVVTPSVLSTGNTFIKSHCWCLKGSIKSKSPETLKILSLEFSQHLVCPIYKKATFRCGSILDFLSNKMWFFLDFLSQGVNWEKRQRDFYLGLKDLYSFSLSGSFFFVLAHTLLWMD